MPSFIAGVSFKKTVGAGFSGANCRAGSLVRIELRGLPTNATLPNYYGMGALAADRVWCHLRATQIVEIREGGVSVFD